MSAHKRERDREGSCDNTLVVVLLCIVMNEYVRARMHKAENEMRLMLQALMISVNVIIYGGFTPRFACRKTI